MKMLDKKRDEFREFLTNLQEEDLRHTLSRAIVESDYMRDTCICSAISSINRPCTSCRASRTIEQLADIIKVLVEEKIIVLERARKMLDVINEVEPV